MPNEYTDKFSWKAEKNETPPQSNMHMNANQSRQMNMNSQKQGLCTIQQGLRFSMKMLIKNRIQNEEFQL